MSPVTCFPKTENHLLSAQKHIWVLCVYLLLSLILLKGIPPLHEIGQTQKVNHLPFPVDQSTENWCVSVGAKFTILSHQRVFYAANIAWSYMVAI